MANLGSSIVAHCIMNYDVLSTLSESRQRLVGLLPLIFFGLHLAHHVHLGDPENMLWACHLANLLIGVGLLLNWRAVVAVGVLWLSIGLPLWISWLSGSPGEFSITSGMTHVGGMVVGVWAMRQMTWPRGIWWKAWLAIPLLQVLSHFTTKTSQEAREENVNISQGVWDGWGDIFPSYPVYLVLILGMVAVVFALVEKGFLR